MRVSVSLQKQDSFQCAVKLVSFERPRSPWPPHSLRGCRSQVHEDETGLRIRHRPRERVARGTLGRSVVHAPRSTEHRSLEGSIDRPRTRELEAEGSLGSERRYANLYTACPSPWLHVARASHRCPRGPLFARPADFPRTAPHPRLLVCQPWRRERANPELGGSPDPRPRVPAPRPVSRPVRSWRTDTGSPDSSVGEGWARSTAPTISNSANLSR